MWWRAGAVAALNYVNGYLVEEVLSVDNLFVMLIIFSYFQVPRHHQHRVLLWGIFGALVMRGVFIVCGVELIERFHWLLYPLGALLVYTALKLLISEEQYDPEHNWFLRFSRRYLPITQNVPQDHFFARVDGRLMMTPLFVVLWVINTTDLLFAIDSVPAVIGVVKPPDAFIVYSSNAFAIVGLRSLYFALAGMMDAFHLPAVRAGRDPGLCRRQDVDRQPGSISRTGSCWPSSAAVWRFRSGLRCCSRSPSRHPKANRSARRANESRRPARGLGGWHWRLVRQC